MRVLRRWSALAVIAAAAYVGSCVGPVPSAWSPGLATATAAVGPTCGKVQDTKPDGTPWRCAFDDEFISRTLNPAKWTAMDSAVTNWNAGIECDTPDNVHVNGHSLVLTATRKRIAQPCGKLPSTRYLSGMVSTVNTFSLTYGRVEMRARLPKGVGMHPAFWMLPTNPSATGSYEYGEIDVAEAYGAYPDTVMPHLHYVSTPNVLGGVNCTVLGATSGYHTYRLDWTPTEMTFTYDGSTCWSTPWQPLYPYASKDATQPVPFDQPFYLLIALAVDGSDSAKNAVTGHTKFPEKMLVDYVRVWE